MKHDNDNEVLVEFAQRVRAAGKQESIALPWQPDIVAGPVHQAAAVALFESGKLGLKKTATGGKLYCSSRTNPLFRLHGAMGSILETLAICIVLLTLFSIGSSVTDFVGMIVAGLIFMVLMYRGILTSKYFYLYGHLPVDWDSQGRIRNGLMFVTSWFAAAMATYFFRRLFVLDVYASGSGGLFAGLGRAFGDGVWWQVVVQDFMSLDVGAPWWNYALYPITMIIPFLITWYLLWSVTRVCANREASLNLLHKAGMHERFTDVNPLAVDDRKAAGSIALYSSLIAAFVFFYSIHYYEGLADKLL